MSSDSTIQEFLLKELEKDTLNEGITTTKAEMLAQKMIDEALAGDQRMMGNLIKFIEKLDLLKEQNTEIKEKAVRANDVTIILDFFENRRNEVNKLIRERKKKRKQSN